MKKLIIFAWILLTLPVLAVDVSVDTAVNSKYIWRGIVLNDHTVFQPGVTVGGNGFSFNVWGNMDLTDDYDHEFEFNEIDYTLSYDWERSGVAWSVGVISYTFPNTQLSSTMEAYAGFTLTDVRFSPSATLYYDFDQVEGFYLELGGSHSFENGVSLGVVLGYGSEDYVDAYFVNEGESGGAFTHYAVSLDYPVALKYGELNFNITYTNLMDSKLHSPGFEADDGNLIVGAGWSYSF